MQRLASGGSPALRKELNRWERREAQVREARASEEAFLEDRYEGYERE